MGNQHSNTLCLSGLLAFSVNSQKLHTSMSPACGAAIRAIRLTAGDSHPDDCWRSRSALFWCWASPIIRSVSTAGERAVGQRPDYRCQQPGVFERHVIKVRVNQGVAYDDRAAVSGAEQLGDVGVLSAAGFGRRIRPRCRIR